MRSRRLIRSAAATALAVAAITAIAALPSAARTPVRKKHAALAAVTATPIKHLVVVFQENVSFDHYFGTYPKATNPAGEPQFHASPDTPTVNGLNDNLLTQNPNTANPQRLDRTQSLTCDQNHDYTPEQQAFDHGLMDKFVQFTNTPSCSPPDIGLPGLVMDYYDGNTVTARWNYAQHFALSANSYNTVFGPSTPGALNLISGQTHGASPADPGVVANGTIFGDDDPAFDDCSAGTKVTMTGTNIGDLLNGRGVTWGWFEGGFRPTSFGPVKCGSSHKNIGGATQTDYSPHHEPFQYYASTSNPSHNPPSSESMIGKTDQANHQYDLKDFWAAVKHGNMPSVSFLKAARYQDGHAGYSDPLDEQHFLVDTINRLESSPDWHNTAVVIAYDDSDGWYDHVMSPIVNQSQDPSYDALTDPGFCGTSAPFGGFQDRCGYGPRLPLLMISPYARQNAIDHTITDQSSILRFIEDNWGTGQIGNSSFDAKAGTLDNMFRFGSGPQAPALFLNPSTGEPQ
ncbi:MAG: alkaline phosphatase family protein [Chloroflexi bacterium]|nr:alkaline phosphatase family protein [Chloroflexota bacterium]